MKLDRRDILFRFMFGAGAWGLRSLASGLPTAFLMNPSTAWMTTPNATSRQPWKKWQRVAHNF